MKKKKKNLVSAHYLTHCPCCEQPVPETIEHFLLDCPRWSVPRNLILRALIERARLCIPPVLSPETVSLSTALLLLGGRKSEGSLDDWVVVEAASEGREAGFITVARYLAVTARLRWSLVWADAPSGVAASDTLGDVGLPG